MLCRSKVIEQLRFDLDLIEVSNGFCFSVRNRRVIPCPINESMRDKTSPRSFIPYDCSTPPKPGYFREGILNSFHDAMIRVNFLNKFYPCLIEPGMPHKVRKQVVAGPKDSGKTCSIISLTPKALRPLRRNARYRPPC